MVIFQREVHVLVENGQRAQQVFTQPNEVHWTNGAELN